MNKKPEFYRIAITAAKAMAEDSSASVAVFLPGAKGAGPVLYRDGEASATAPDFDRLHDHGVPFVYVQAGDYRKCESFLEGKLTELLHQANVPSAEKARIVHQVGASVARDLTNGPVTPSGVNRATALIDNVIACVLKDPVVAGHMLHMAGHERTTASHMFVVSALAVVLGAEAFGADHEILADLGLAGMMHDLGKLGIDADILNKATPLTPEEMQLIHQHPIESVRLLGDDPKVTPAVRQMILQHHEWIDGRGYPVGASGRDILPGSRILTIVDSFHAMIGRRSYRDPLTPHEANRALLAQSGRQFDPEMLACWTTLFDRCWARAETGMPMPPTEEVEELSTRHEHRAVQPPRRFYGSRARRFSCDGRVTIRCVYAGRLPDATLAPDSFAAEVHDISRSGLCVYTHYPMYRGEMLNVQMQHGAETIWVRGNVAWCRKHDSGRYRSGLRFMKRLSPGEIDESVDLEGIMPAEVAPAAESDLLETSNAADAPEKQEAKPVTASNTQDSAAEALRTLASLGASLDPRRISSDDERAVVALSEFPDAAVRKKSVELMTRIASKSSRLAIMRLLKDPDADVRQQTLLAAAALEMGEATYVIIRLLEDPVPAVAVSAAAALGRMGDNTGLSVVEKNLASDGPAARMAARALGEIVGHRFPGNAEGIKAARRYLSANRKTLGVA